MKRREFLQNACKAGVGIAIGGALFDLSKVATIKASSRALAPEVREIPLNLEDTPELQKVGGSYHLEVEDLNRDILVARVTEKTFVAVDIKCTHKGCDVSYEAERNGFYCPCHASLFDLTGKPVKGPAKKPLTWYHAELRENEVVVTVYGPNDPVPANCIPDTTKQKVVQVDTSSVFREEIK